MAWSNIGAAFFGGGQGITGEAGGQTSKAPFERLFCEMEYGRPMKISTQTVEELKQARLIQDRTPLPWRDEELKHVVRALGIEEEKEARGFEGGSAI